ncbi:hypothetical protein P8625_07825 [Tenacibaculum tangerinum]|uniref:TonB C-terminal domain-containing protein n=1 Tax=Tenacibaculum tangerinum TaxID=3038772 RepID=A0ABY8L6N1_9FLAO|nr:hypothetical protein [Tenacibaculum tangerinum]WGH77032.1 hypothetical protein P8625_07825 [Tenacibaculum tangerinum]
MPFKKGERRADADNVVNFTKVDVSPSFTSCINLPVQEKDACFREEIHKRIATSLQQYNFTTATNLNEEVVIKLLINKKGKFLVEKIIASKTIDSQLPALDSIIKLTIAKLPTVQPAMKRGVPVTTQYQLPITIKTP